MKALIPMQALPLLLAACAPPSERPSPAAAQRVTAEVAQQVRRCYRAPRLPSAGRGIVTRLLVRYGPDGMLVGLPIFVWQQGVTPESRPYADRMAEAARLAVLRCSPIRLPAGLGQRRTSDFYLTFSPQMRA